MRSNQTTQLSAILLSACLAGMAQQAAAQGPTREPAAQTTPAMDPQAIPQTTPQIQVEETSTPAPLPKVTVPSYQPREYMLTAPGSNSGPRSEVRRWPNRPLLITSSLMFTAAYVPAVLDAKFNNDTTHNLYIPVAGPWLEMARESASPGNMALLAVTGVFQDLGALGLVTSLFVPEHRTSHWFLIGNKRLSAAPMANKYMYGLSARGRF